MAYKFNPFTGTFDVTDGIGITQAAADARYLKLAADNDPITGTLHVNVSGTVTGAIRPITISTDGGSASGFRLYRTDQSTSIGWDFIYGWDGSNPGFNIHYSSNSGPVLYSASDGRMIIGSTDTFVAPFTNTTLALKASAATRIPLAVRGFASQSANLTEWQNNSGTVLSQVTSAGHILLANNIQLQGKDTGGTAENLFSVSTSDTVEMGTENLDTNIYAATNLDLIATTTFMEGHARIATYLRVGSISAPTNTTAGDLTGVRLSLGNTALGTANGMFIAGSGTVTDTSGTVRMYSFQPTMTPASNSTATFQALHFLGIWNPATGITQTAIRGFDSGLRIRGDGLIGTVIGYESVAFAVDSSSLSTAQATNVYGIESILYSRPSGTTAVTIGTGIAFRADPASGSTGLTATTLTGFAMVNPAANTITTLIGLDIPALTRASGSNIGVRIGLPSGATANYALQLSDTGGTAAGGITFGTDATLYRIAADVLATDDSMRVATYLRVGSTSAPANTTAGDLTAVRLSLGNGTFAAAQQFYALTATMTDTANAAAVAMNATITLAPASSSSADFRVMNMSARPSGAQNMTNIIQSIQGEVRETGTAGTRNITVGVRGTGYIHNSGSWASTVTLAAGFYAQAVSQSGNPTGGTVTTGAGVKVINSSVGSGGFALTTQVGIDVDALTAASTNNIGVRIAAPSGGATANYALQITGAGTFITAGRILGAQGADVASANNLALGSDGNVFEITGTTQINLISNVGWQNGSKITLLFTSTPTVKHNQTTSSTDITIQLAGAADFAATAGDTLTLVLSEIGGTQAWREIGRAVI